MKSLIDSGRWDELIKSPDWYIKIWPEIQAAREMPKGAEYRNQARDYFIDRLARDKIALGTTGDNMDSERKPIDTIVVHHTSSKDTYTLDRLNAVHLINLYVPYYIDPYLESEKHLKGTPLWSNHIIDGKQVFYAYHWMIRKDGKAERLLRDDQIGWQSGDWGTNCRSVAICLDDDYEESEPPQAMLDAVADIIKRNYSFVDLNKIIGHSEVKPERKKTCPGGLFMSSWKKKILNELK